MCVGTSLSYAITEQIRENGINVKLREMALKKYITHLPCTVPKIIDFPRYNMKCIGENVILRGIVHVVSGFPLHFMFPLRKYLLSGGQ